jgi:hypothetical protein
MAFPGEASAAMTNRSLRTIRTVRFLLMFHMDHPIAGTDLIISRSSST